MKKPDMGIIQAKGEFGGKFTVKWNEGKKE